MLALSGHTRIMSNITANLEWTASYSQAPLNLAVRIAQSMQSDDKTRKLLYYYQKAIIERGRPSWFINLYKVREFLSKIYDGEQATKDKLGISEGWSFFGRILNDKDLRHAAEIQGIAPSISLDEIDKLYRLAHSWVASFLRVEHELPTVG